MPKGMHLVLGLSSLNTRKKKPKITKKRMKQLVEEHRLYNKKMKQTNNRDMMMSFDNYLKRQFGQVKHKPRKNTGTYQPIDMTITRNTGVPSHTIDMKDLQHACSKPDNEYKREISSQYVIGQAYNKSGLQVLTKKEIQDPNTGKRR